MTKIFLFSFFIALSVSTVAQDSTSSKELGEVIVTGQYRPQSLKSSVYQVKVINSERIRQQGATRIMDVLRTELNIRFNQDLPTGGSGITLSGLSGQNVKLLLDGVPVGGRQGFNNEFDVNQIDINSIERIEIVEGPMSVQFGADALAGVINIITKKAKTSGISVNARLHEETAGSEYGIKQGTHNQAAGLTWKNKSWEIGGSVGRNYFGGWKDTASGRELIWHKKDQIVANGFIGFTRNKFNIRYRIDGIDEIITNPGNYTAFDLASGQTFALDQEYLSQRVIHQLQAGYFVNSRLSFQGQSSYTNYGRQVYSTTVSKETGAVRLNPAAGSQSEVDFTTFNFRASALYRLNEKFSFQPGVDINTETGNGERLSAGENKIQDYAFYISSEYTPTKAISIRPGLRFIHNSVYDAPPVVPSLNTKFRLGSNLDLRASYARGFRSPSLRELYFNFFDANHQIVGNPDLKAETSNSYNASLTWSKLSRGVVAYTTVLGGFYNDVENMIDYAPSASDPNLFILSNVSNSRTAGATITTMAKYKQLNISVGAGYTGFYNAYAESDKSLPELQWSFEANTNVGYVFEKLGGLGVNLFYKFTGERPQYAVDGNDFVLVKNKGYHWADITLNKKLLRYLNLSAGVRNLFDVSSIRSARSGGSTHSTGGATSIGTGRSYFAGLTFFWNKK